ncbi:hypothetical protein PIB30_044008 [Stylosanthes scabra]|uniref:Uncharacterized protein n=1 Tax=Stylosanthes scabra TaxID=79078 RepID=A0ABU6WFD7_9FABA|nr:hypothetical protein [Stylosanthes scabra]
MATHSLSHSASPSSVEPLPKEPPALPSLLLPQLLPAGGPKLCSPATATLCLLQDKPHVHALAPASASTSASLATAVADLNATTRSNITDPCWKYISPVADGNINHC